MLSGARFFAPLLLGLMLTGCQDPRNSLQSSVTSSTAAASAPPALRLAYLRARQAEATAAYSFRAAVSREGLDGENPAHGFRVRLGRAGEVEVTSLGTGSGNFRLGLRFGAYGSADTGTRATVRAGGNLAEVQREAGPAREVREWYVNGPAGLEQGFTVARPPARRAGEGLLLAVMLSGDLAPQLASDGEAVELVNREGLRVLTYGGLHVEDAGGNTLPSKLELRQDKRVVELRVDDRGAAYPVTVDPWVQTAKLLASDGAPNMRFGLSVAMDGDTAVAGSYSSTGTGSAYVFVRSGTAWSEQQKLVASDAANGDQFGSSVALSVNTAVVGASGKGTGTGAAYVFVRSGTSWSEQQKLVAADAATGDGFGSSVALSGDTALVGAPPKSSGSGAAYVFVRSGTSWSQQQKLTAADAAAGDSFGSVALSVNTALVGAPYKSSSTGAAYVFVRSGTTWSEQQKLTAADAATGDGFGRSVGLSGDTALVGANQKSNATGAAYVFVRNGTLWSHQTKLTAADAATGDGFGSSVGLSGDTALAGAPANSLTGAAYVFVRSGTSWSQQTKLTAADAAAGDSFGAVGLSGSTALVGAPLKNSSTGAAYVFDLKLAQGSPCSLSSSCLSGHCVNGFCCNTACNTAPAACQTCSQALGASQNGTCTILAGHTCDDGIPCTKGDVCNGAGVCAGTSYPCTPGQCELTSTCDGQGGCTVAKKADGTSCSTGQCVAGVCLPIDAGPSPDVKPEKEAGAEAGAKDVGADAAPSPDAKPKKEAGAKDVGADAAPSPDAKPKDEGGAKDVGAADAALSRDSTVLTAGSGCSCAMATSASDRLASLLFAVLVVVALARTAFRRRS